MISYRQLLDLRLGKVKEAVDDWREMVDALEALAGEKGKGGGGDANASDLAKKAEGSDWRGNNATVTKKFLVKTAREFGDVLATAKSVHVILSGLHRRMDTCKEDLKRVVAQAPKSVHVTGHGTVEARDGAHPKPTQEEIDAVAGDIKDILKAASLADEAAVDALQHEAKGKYNFLSTRIESFESVQRAVRDSESFLKLAKKDPRVLSNTQLDSLNEWVNRNEGNPLFAERIATEMGPKRTLEFFAGAMDFEKWKNRNDGDSREAVKVRKKLLGELETGLGTTLATASRSETPAMESWKKGIVALGDQPVAGTSQHKPVYGFQAMSNLLRHGKYDSGFLNTYGDALVRYERAHTGDVTDPGPGGRKRKNVLPWDSLPSYAKSNQIHFGPGSGKDAGLDPMTGFMKALAHNPDASSQFFGSKGGQDNAEWVLKERKPFNDIVADGFGESPERYTGPKASWNATGDALVAGATGIDPDDPKSASPGHTAEQKSVLERSLHNLAARKDSFPVELRDDMAKVLVNHGDQVHSAASAHSDENVLNRRELLEVSKQVSRDQNSYGILNDGMNREIIRDIHASHAKDPHETLQRAGRTVGFLEEARYQALADKDAADKKDIAWSQTFAYHGLGAAAGFIPEGHVAGIVDREAYLLSFKWRQDEEGRVTEATHQQNGATFDVRERQLDEIGRSWKKANPETPESAYTATEEATTSAANGNKVAQGLPGRQSPH